MKKSLTHIHSYKSRDSAMIPASQMHFYSPETIHKWEKAPSFSISAAKIQKN